MFDIFKAKVKVSAKNSLGASMVEYAILLALIAIVAITALSTMGTALDNQFNDLANKLNAA